MTEEEVLERFDKYGNAIITLKKKLEEKTQENTNLESVKSALDIAISNLENEQKAFKEKTYQTIKYLVENVIEPMEKEINTPKRGNVQALEELARLKEDNQMLNDTLTTLGSEKEYLAQSCEHFNEENFIKLQKDNNTFNDKIDEFKFILDEELKNKGLDSTTIDLLIKMLELDPNKRINIEKAINHEYFKVEPKMMISLK
jgi:serine/threonine protein kinase